MAEGKTVYAFQTGVAKKAFALSYDKKGTNLPKDLQEKLRKGIMDLKGARFGKLGVITAMDPATDADYNVIRDLVAFQDKMKAAARK